MPTAALITVALLCVSATYEREGTLNVTDATVVHIPSNNDTTCVVGTMRGEVHFLTREGKKEWQTISITETVTVTGGGRIVAAASEPKGATHYVASNSHLTIIDGRHFATLSELALPSGAAAFHLAAPYLYISGVDKMVYTVNVSDPTTPEILSSAAICGTRIAAMPGYLFAACDADGGKTISIYNMTDSEVFTQVHQLTLPSSINGSLTDVLYNNKGLFMLATRGVAYYDVAPPVWGVENLWELRWAAELQNGVLARSWPVGAGTSDVFVSTPGEVKQVDGDDRTVSAYVVKEADVSSVSVYQQRRLFAVVDGGSRLVVYSLSKSRDFSPGAVLGLICGSIAVVLALGGLLYYHKQYSAKHSHGERESFHGDATADRVGFNTF